MTSFTLKTAACQGWKTGLNESSDNESKLKDNVELRRTTGLGENVLGVIISTSFTLTLHIVT